MANQQSEPETPKERAENVLLVLGEGEYANLSDDARALARDVLGLIEQFEALVGSYVCENCGRLGPLSSFNDDCTPGWTHGRMIEVKSLTSNPAMSQDES